MSKQHFGISVCVAFIPNTRKISHIGSLLLKFQNFKPFPVTETRLCLTLFQSS